MNEPTKERIYPLADYGESRSARRLLAGLDELGVVFPDHSYTYRIMRDHAQGALNARMGEYAPTWHMRYGVPANRKNQPTGYGIDPEITHRGESYTGICGAKPLTWILRKKPKEWVLYRHEIGHALMVDTRDTPPQWR